MIFYARNILYKDIGAAKAIQELLSVHVYSMFSLLRARLQRIGAQDFILVGVVDFVHMVFTLPPCPKAHMHIPSCIDFLVMTKVLCISLNASVVTPVT